MDQNSSIEGSGSDIELITMAAMEDEAEKRAHHNALERKRRDHIKDSFYCLRDAVPQLRGEKASRALILNKATDYIKCLKSKNMCHKKEIDDIKKQNDVLEQEIDRIIKINNSMGKDRLDILKATDELLSGAKKDNPLSTPPTFTRITEKEKGPFIGKRDVDDSDSTVEGNIANKATSGSLKKIQLRHFTTAARTGKIKESGGGAGGIVVAKSEDVGNGTGNPIVTCTSTTSTTTASTTTNNSTATSEKKQKPAQSINFAQIGSNGTIKIPATALAKALPNGLKNVTAFYQHSGSNKPIRLQIITPNGKTKSARIISTSVKKTPDDKTEVKKDEKEEEEEKKQTEKKSGDAEATPENNTKEAENKKLDDLEMKIPSIPINQPLYAKFKILPVTKLISNSNSKNNSSSSVTSDGNYVQIDENKRREQEIGAMSEFDSYKNIPIPEPGKVEPVPVRYPGRNYPRDHSGMATISESELAYLTRPTSNNSPNNKDVLGRGGPNSSASKIEHGNIPILYKGSLISERDNELDNEIPQPTQILLGARATDGSKPFSCHICGKSFNMLSSLKVHEHIHVPVKKKPYPCDLCHRSFMTLRILSQHKESHYGRISNFHRRAALCKSRQTHQNSIGKRATFNYATHLQNTKVTSGHNPHSPRTSIPNIFSVNAGDGNVEKKPAVISNFPRTFSPSPTPKSGPQRSLPTTRVRQGQVIVQARQSGLSSYRTKTPKIECPDDGNKLSNKGLAVKRSIPDNEVTDKRGNKVIVFDSKITVP